MWLKTSAKLELLLSPFGSYIYCIYISMLANLAFADLKAQYVPFSRIATNKSSPEPPIPFDRQKVAVLFYFYIYRHFLSRGSCIDKCFVLGFQL